MLRLGRLDGNFLQGVLVGLVSGASSEVQLRLAALLRLWSVWRERLWSYALRLNCSL